MPLPECTRRDFEDDAAQQQLLDAGWRQVEVLETWHGRVRPLIGLAIEEDIPNLIAIAVSSYTEDRLHRDDLVPKEIADASKAKWVMDAVRDEMRRVFVYRDPDPVGFLSATTNGTSWRVDLLAVRSDCRGRRIGKALIDYACRYYDLWEVTAGTQVNNEPARKLYGSLGMTVVKLERTFHR